METDDISIENYTLDELNQLRELVMQSYAHYKKLLDDGELMKSIQEGDARALQFCIDETMAELEEIDKKVSSRRAEANALTHGEVSDPEINAGNS